jgi:hypothetical protein
MKVKNNKECLEAPEKVFSSIILEKKNILKKEQFQFLLI